MASNIKEIHENLIVSGIQRTGTSIVMKMIENKDYKIFKDENYYEKDEEYTKFQENFNESEFVDGIKNEEEYSKLNHKVIKIFISGLVNTDIKFFETFKLIVITFRNWRDHYHSWDDMLELNVKNILKKFPDSAKRIEAIEPINIFYKKNFSTPDLFYGKYYTDIIIDSIKRKYTDKVFYLNFDDIISDVSKVKKRVKFELNDRVFNSDHPKNYKSQKEVPCEFEKYYHIFLDKLYYHLSGSQVTQEFLNECVLWNGLITKKVELTNYYLKKYSPRISIMIHCL